MKKKGRRLLVGERKRRRLRKPRRPLSGTGGKRKNSEVGFNACSPVRMVTFRIGAAGQTAPNSHAKRKPPNWTASI